MCACVRVCVCACCSGRPRPVLRTVSFGSILRVHHIKYCSLLVAWSSLGQPVMFFSLSGFESLQKAFQKAKPVVEKEGTTPWFYVRSLVELEDFVKDVRVFT